MPQLGLQDDSADLRLSLWNVVEPRIFRTRYAEEFRQRAEFLCMHFIRMPTNQIPHEALGHQFVPVVQNCFFQLNIDRFYDFIDAMPHLIAHGARASIYDLDEVKKRSDQVHASLLYDLKDLCTAANDALEHEGSPYRFVRYELAPITTEAELMEVRRALLAPDRFAPAREHIEQALQHLGARPPAYADAIKQAVSAVESALKIATGAGDGVWKMGALLKEFEEKFSEIHPSLRIAIDKIYGYASDEEGVRHGATELVRVGDAEARALVVTCSALMNFLIAKAA